MFLFPYAMLVDSVRGGGDGVNPRLASPLPRHGALADRYPPAAARALSGHNVDHHESAQGAGGLHAGNWRIEADAVFDVVRMPHPREPSDGPFDRSLPPLFQAFFSLSSLLSCHRYRQYSLRKEA